jgi:hypothetical protein
MIRRALLAAMFLAAGLGETASATTPLQIWIDPDGTTYLENTTAAPISFDGYQIASETNRLDPAGWISIADQVAADPLGIITKLGAGALAFGEANPGPGNLAELNVAGVATLAAHARFAIGKPFLDGQLGADDTADLYYKVAGQPGPSGPIILLGAIVPEPSTCLLAVMAVLGLLAFQGRFRR